MDNILLEEIKKLRKEGLGITKIARKINKCTDTIREYLVLLKELPETPVGKGGRKRKYTVNDSFFEKIDSEAKAYVLGLIFADGCVHPKRHRFSITLKSSDEQLLVKVNELLESNFPINRYSARYNEKYKFTEKSSLQVTSKKILKDLENFGCVSKKSNILTFPKIDEEYKNHFMRGYFDGDGSVYLAGKRKEIIIDIISTKEFCEVFLKNLPYNGKTTVKKDNRYEKNIHYIKIGGNNQVKIIYNFLYHNANVFLQRKKDVFETHYKKRES